MKMIKLLLVSFFVLFVSTAHANGEFIGPALRVEPDGLCGTTLGDEYQYWGTQWIQYSNGKKGHATVKCKMELFVGEGVIYYSEFDSGSFPLGGDAMCYTTVELDVDKGTWTSQCFGAWNSGD